MATNKLTSEQRSTLLEWLAADYDWRLIKQWFKERQWPEISKALVSYYRKSRDIGIENLRAERRNKALTTGLALKEERIARLKTNADTLEAIKWIPDKNGKLVNEKAWRECLADIAAEMGHRKVSVEVTVFDSLAAKLGVTQAEARTLAERITKGEITIADVMTGKVKASSDINRD